MTTLASPHATRAGARPEARRSPRVMLRVPLRIEADGASGAAHTVIVNRQGALVLGRLRCAEGVPLDVWNLETGERALCRVVLYGGEDLPGLHKLGIVLMEDRPGFWGAEYEELAAS
jgi:hypothetical protein